MDGDCFIDPTPDNPIDAARFLSFLDLSPILAVLESFYCEPWRHRHPPEAILRLYALYRLKRQVPAELWRLLGFKWRPSYKTVWHWLNVRVKAEGLILIHEALMNAVREALKARGVEMKPDWRGKLGTLRLRYRKMVKAGILKAERLLSLGLSPDPEENTLDGILSSLALAGQYKYVGAYYRNRSLEEARIDNGRWRERYAQLHNRVDRVEGSHGHQKDWLGLDDLRSRGLRKAMIHTALTMLTEAMVAYTRVQNGVAEGLTSLAGIK